MTLRCSLLGHRFEEATVEREREERGDEVVTVSREVETCSRCDARRVVSENTEVTTVDPAPDEAGTVDSGGFGGVVERSGVGGDAASATTDQGGETFQPPDDPAEEDAEILTEEEEAGERQPGEWPEEPETTPDEPAADPTEATAAEETAADSGSAGPPEQVATTDESTFACPSCGFTTAIEGSSLRRGDACPECMDGYLETR
jgi:hypothetical protein